MEQTEEELLEYARLNYPIGTRYIPVHVNTGINEVIDTNYKFSKPHIFVTRKTIENNMEGCIYERGKWATIVSKPEEVKEFKPQFIVGKWYTSENWTHDSYCKFLEINNCGDFEYTECIYEEEYHNNRNSWNNVDDIVEAPLELIQPFLPEGHIDKLVVKPKDEIPNTQSVIEKTKSIKYGNGFTIGEKVMYKGEIHTIEAFCLHRTILISGPKGNHSGKSNPWLNEYGEDISHTNNEKTDKFWVDIESLSKLTVEDKIGELQKSLDEQSESKKYTYNEGDYIVCNEDISVWIKKGEIAILGGKYWNTKEVNKLGYLNAITVNSPSGNGCSIKSDFRHATEVEIEAYKNGIRNISDIKQSTSINIPEGYIMGIDPFEFSKIKPNEVQLLQPKEDKRFNTSVNKIESVKIQLKQKSKSIKF